MKNQNEIEDATGNAKNSPENDCDDCRKPTCHSRIHVRDMISERGSVTLCRYCRNQFVEVGS